MRCSKCGSDNREGRRFCRSCGSKLNTVCPKCGAANEPDENFCGDCGTGLAPESKPLAVLLTDEKFGVKEAALASVDGERKTVTALFADLKGSTELEQDLDPEEAREIVDPALKLMIDAVRRYDGYIVQSTGDGVFALFGAPIAHEDHPQCALYAALRMQEDLQRYSARLRETGNLPLEARVGANTGEVVVRSIATGHEQTEYTPIGHTTNLASRMQALAPTGSIAISEATRKLVEGFFALKPLGPTRVKGVNEPVNVYQVTGLGPLRTRLQRAAGRGLTKFVGREREMAALAHAAERTKSGHGEIVAAMAEAGAGKSRLFFEFKAKHQSGWMVLETFSVSHGKASAYLPVIELLHGYFGIEGADDARKRREKVAGRIAILDRALEDTLPYLCALLSIVEGDDPLAQMDGQLKKRRTLDAIKRILLRESLSQPLMVIFEDLHWIDEETQGLLNLLADSIANAKILLLVNYRPEYSHNWNSKTYYMQLRLDPLGEESAEEMLSALLGDGPELGQLKRVITEKTEGNPFFMEETVQALLDEGALVRNGVTKLTKPIAALKIPLTVQAILASRIDRLSQDAKELLQSLAVIGREFPLSLIRAVGSKPDDEINHLLDDLRLSEFIYEQPAIGDSEYIFKHALIQEVAYNSILLERRKHLHEAIGAGLERQYANSIDDHLDALAHHYSRSGNVPKALEYLERAGQQAVQRSAYYEAMRHFTSALELLQCLPQMVERDQRELALQTSLGQVLMTIKGHAAPETEKVFLRASELARTSETPEQRFSALCGRFGHAYVGGRMSLARDRLKETLEFIKDHPEPVFVLETCHHEWSLALSTGELDAAQRHANQAVTLAQELRDSLSLAFALATKAQLHQFKRDLQSALATAEAAIAKAEEVGFPYFLSLAQVVKGWALAELARADEALGEIREAMAVLSASRAEVCFTLALATLATVCSRADYIDEGLEAITDALLRIEHDGERCWEAEIHRLRGELLLRQNDSNLVPAKSCFERAIQIASRQGAKSLQLRTTMSLGRLLASQGYREGARSMLGEIYNWFTEGFDTADLKEAKALLDELSR